MIRPRPIFQCPLCGEMAPLAALVADARGVEMTCAKCKNSVRFKPFAEQEDEASSSVVSTAATSPVDTKTIDSKAVDAKAVDAKTEAQTIESALPPQKPDAQANDKISAVLQKVPELHKDLAAAYQEAVTTGDSLQEHENVVKRAAVLKQLKELGRVHKLRLEQDPNDAVAKACQAFIVDLAFSDLKPTKVEQGLPPDKSKQAVIVTLSLLVIVAVIAWMYHQGLL